MVDIEWSIRKEVSRFKEGDSVSRFDTGHSGRTGNNKESIGKKLFIVFVFVGIIG